MRCGLGEIQLGSIAGLRWSQMPDEDVVIVIEPIKRCLSAGTDPDGIDTATNL